MTAFRATAIALSTTLCLWLPASHAQMYQCKGPDGRTSFQDQPCPGGATGAARATPATGPGVVVACRANLALPGAPPNVLAVRITRTAAGVLKSEIDGNVSNPDVAVVESAIRPGFDFQMDPFKPDNRGLNAGEVSLAHLHDISDLIDLPFNLKDVRRTVIYVLSGPDKFGGVVLIEAYSASDRFLGRVLRAVMAGRCA